MHTSYQIHEKETKNAISNIRQMHNTGPYITKVDINIVSIIVISHGHTVV